MADCPSCGADVLDIDVRCSRCGHRLTSTGAQRMLGSVVLGQYEIQDVLGQGGMAVVYRARHQLTEQEVALKILPPELAAHAQVKSRFLEEAKALAQLDHPNIVHLYNFGQENGCFVLAMQFVQGATWERMILEAGKLPWQLSARICIDVLKALEYAHGRGIIHRDMKPSNVLVRESDGTATVMDFGIAKMTTSSKLTATGQTMGTVRYMSPEQVRGLSVDARTDIYSLGATLYESVCGDTPFDGDTHFEIMTKHLNEPPAAPSAVGVEVPPAFERALMRSMAKRPDDRFASATEMREALERSLDEDRMGEVETLRMTRDVISRTRKSTAASRPVHDLASRLEPTGGTDKVAGEAAEVDDTPAGKRGPWLWIGLAVTVLAASAVVVFLVVTRDDKGARGGARPPGDGVIQAPSRPQPFALPGVSWAVDQDFPGDKLRVLAVDRTDPQWVREQVLAADRGFVEFARGKGYKDAFERPELSVELVPPSALCAEGIYREPGSFNETALARCKDARHWYRVDDSTLLVSTREPLADSLAHAVAEVLCITAEPGIDECGTLPGEFAQQHK